VPGLIVIARNSSFAYKGKAPDLRVVAKDLGVRYVVEGSVRRAATRIRISAQLIDASDHSHLWVDRFDRDLADVFALQDEIVGKIVNALAGVLPTVSIVTSRRASNLEAYDLFVRGRVLATKSPDDNRIAQSLLEKSIEIDADFAPAHAWLAMAHATAWANFGEPMDRHFDRSLTSGRRAVTLDPGNADAHSVFGYVLMYSGRLEEGEAELRRALQINPNHADALAFLGELKALQGNAASGIDDIRKAFRLNPLPQNVYYWMLGYAQYAAGHYQDAVETLRLDATHRTGSQRILAASLAQLGHLDEARKEAKEFLSMVPNFTVTQWAATQPFKNDADRQRFVEGYLKAGLPR
jgi:tetratricopeptide (TPR) repeat protein